MKIHALGTHSDWVYNGGAWGRPGHQRIADLTFAAGIRRLYWRTHNGGQAKYPSKVCTIEDGAVYRDPKFDGLGSLPKSYFAYGQYLDYREWDQVTDMAEIGSSVGLEVCHWYTVFEDDHGGHLASDFGLENPRFRCTLKTGEQIPGCMDFWYPEVQEYKLAIIDELLEKPTKRLLLDFLRRNGKPSADAAGNFRYGYNPEIVAGFASETGLDAFAIEPNTPEWEKWLDYNARPLTEFLRKVKARAAAKGLPVDILVWALDTRKWMAFDIAAIAREGLVEDILTGTQRYAYSAADARRQVTRLREQLGDLPNTILPGLFAYSLISPLSIDEFNGEAEAMGCEAMVLHEANHVVECPVTDRLRAWSYDKPHSRREVVSHSSGDPVTYSGFIKCHDIFHEACNQQTEFTVSHTAEELKLTVTCHERNPAGLLPVPGLGTDNYNANELKARAFWNPFESVTILLDADHNHENYHHFVLDPSGAKLSEQRFDEDWTGEWHGEAEIAAKAWIATFRIPWKTLGIQPAAGRTLGLQVVRMQFSPRELSSWFCANGRRMNPAEFGHLRLA